VLHSRIQLQSFRLKLEGPSLSYNLQKHISSIQIKLTGSFELGKVPFSSLVKKNNAVDTVLARKWWLSLGLPVYVCEQLF
jgi:hypothetical protein